MLGLFDSGSGGLNTVRYIKKVAPRVDLVYVIDRENAPYGIKTEQEILDITKENIDRLISMRAERVLIACCTASTVWPHLGEAYRRVSIPIIDAVAKEAECLTSSGRIGVIATPLTVTTHAFQKALPHACVTELPLGELVPLIDGGLSDSTATSSDEEMLKEMLKYLEENSNTTPEKILEKLGIMLTSDIQNELNE